MVRTRQDDTNGPRFDQSRCTWSGENTVENTNISASSRQFSGVPGVRNHARTERYWNAGSARLRVEVAHGHPAARAACSSLPDRSDLWVIGDEVGDVCGFDALDVSTRGHRADIGPKRNRDGSRISRGNRL